MNCATATERQRIVKAVNVSDIKISVVHFEPTSHFWEVGSKCRKSQFCIK